MTTFSSIPLLLEELARVADPIKAWLNTPGSPMFEPCSLHLDPAVFAGWFGPLEITSAAVIILARHKDAQDNQQGLEVLFNVNAPESPFLHGNKRMLTRWVSPVFNVLGVELDLSAPQTPGQVVISFKRALDLCTFSVVYFPRK